MDIKMMHILNLYCKEHRNDLNNLSKLSECRSYWVEKNIINVIEFTIKKTYNDDNFRFDRSYATAIWGTKDVMDEQLSNLKSKFINNNILLEYIEFVNTTFEDKNNTDKYYYRDSLKYINYYRQENKRECRGTDILDESFCVIGNNK